MSAVQTERHRSLSACANVLLYLETIEKSPFELIKLRLFIIEFLHTRLSDPKYLKNFSIDSIHVVVPLGNPAAAGAHCGDLFRLLDQ